MRPWQQKPPAHGGPGACCNATAHVPSETMQGLILCFFKLKAHSADFREEPERVHQLALTEEMPLVPRPESRAPPAARCSQ